MFGSKPKTSNEPSQSSALAANQPAELSSGDVIIHTMPREFYGLEASLSTAEPTAKPTAAPTPLPPPAPIPPPTVVIPPPAMGEKVGVLKHKHSWKGPIITFLVMLIILAAGGFAAYRIIDSAKQQKQLAETELNRLREQEAQQAAAAAAKAAQDAADAAALAAIPVPAKDTDSDGLTDIEELLYGTNFREPDSDQDTFLDGNEVFHGYDPLGLAPLTLLDTKAVKIFADSAFAFSIYYPTTWTPVPSVDGSSIVFRSSRQASVNVTSVTKPSTQSLADWYNAEAAGNDAKQLKEKLTKEGLYGLTTVDDRTTYLDGTTSVITLTYDLGARSQIEYLQTFAMMVNSFHFNPVP